MGDKIMSENERVEHSRQTVLNRRSVLVATASLILAHDAVGAEKHASQPQVLQEGDLFKLDDEPETIIEKAYQLGYKYEKENGGCARCTVAALQDALPMVAVDEGVFRTATCLDGGATPVAEQNCGGFTGAGIIIGFVCGSRRNGSFHGSSKLAHRLLHQVYHRFAKEYGTVLCRDVRKGVQGDCPEAVGRAARWTAEVLLAEFCGWKAPEKETCEQEPK